MDLSAVMGLVIEQMAECRGDPLAYRSYIGCRHICEAAGKAFGVHTFNIFADALVFGPSHVTQFDEIVGDDGVELVWMITFAGKAFHPDAVSNQQVVEGSMHRSEK